jgi:hypothetical protein
MDPVIPCPKDAIAVTTKKSSKVRGRIDLNRAFIAFSCFHSSIG